MKHLINFKLGNRIQVAQKIEIVDNDYDIEQVINGLNDGSILTNIIQRELLTIPELKVIGLTTSVAMVHNLKQSNFEIIK